MDQIIMHEVKSAENDGIYRIYHDGTKNVVIKALVTDTDKVTGKEFTREEFCERKNLVIARILKNQDIEEASLKWRDTFKRRTVDEGKAEGTCPVCKGGPMSTVRHEFDDDAAQELEVYRALKCGRL